MKKWVSLLLGASLTLVTPVSAFATGLHEKSEVNVNGQESGKFQTDGKGKSDIKVKLEQNVKANAETKVNANEDGDHEGDNNGQDGNMNTNGKIKLDGVIDTEWKNAERIAFKDTATGLDGYCRFMWDKDNLYVLVELQGAAKLWKESNKPVLFSLWYNGDEQVNGGKAKEDGFVAVTWPDMTVYHDNGLHLGWFKPDMLVKAFATNGDDVNLELKLPWVNNNGIRLSDNIELGLCIKLKELAVAVPDVNGKIMINLTEQQIKDLKGELTVLPLQLGASRVAGASDNASGVTFTPAPLTAVKGVSDTKGVIPSGMPQTGGGGASEWTD